MICLLSVSTATLGSRWWLLCAATLRRIPQSQALVAIVVPAIAAAAAAAWFGDTIANQFRGPGMLLLLAIALLFAAAGMAWPVRPLSDRLTLSIRGPWSASVLLAAAMLSDSGPFIIMAAAARTGNAMFAGVGGAIGLIAAAALAGVIGGGSTMPPWLQVMRWAIAATLALIGAVAALVALGLF